MDGVYKYKMYKTDLHQYCIMNNVKRCLYKQFSQYVCNLILSKMLSTNAVSFSFVINILPHCYVSVNSLYHYYTVILWLWLWMYHCFCFRHIPLQQWDGEDNGKSEGENCISVVSSVSRWHVYIKWLGHHVICASLMYLEFQLSIS